MHCVQSTNIYIEIYKKKTHNRIIHNLRTIIWSTTDMTVYCCNCCKTNETLLHCLVNFIFNLKHA